MTVCLVVAQILLEKQESVPVKGDWQLAHDTKSSCGNSGSLDRVCFPFFLLESVLKLNFSWRAAHLLREEAAPFYKQRADTPKVCHIVLKQAPLDRRQPVEDFQYRLQRAEIWQPAQCKSEDHHSSKLCHSYYLLLKDNYYSLIIRPTQHLPTSHTKRADSACSPEARYTAHPLQ